MGANQMLSITIMRFVFSCGAFSIITLSICFFDRGNFEKNNSHAGAVGIYIYSVDSTSISAGPELAPHSDQRCVREDRAG